MNVYVDILFCQSLIIDYFLLLAFSKLAGVPLRRGRHIAAAALGGLYSMIIFLPEIWTPLTILANLMFAWLMLLVAIGRKPLRIFFKFLALFFLVNFIFAGSMMALWFALRPTSMVLHNGAVYFNLSAVVLILSAVACYLIFALFARILRKQTPQSLLYKLEISTPAGFTVIEGMLDTGNSLTDLFTDTPVVVADYKAIEPILPPCIRPAFLNPSVEATSSMDEYWSARYRLIPYSSVSGTGLLPAFKPMRFAVRQGDATTEVYGVLVAVSQHLQGNCRAVINPEIIEQTTMEVKKCLKA